MGGDKSHMVTQDYNDSFVRYLNNAAPGLVHETSDISCISKTTGNNVAMR